MNAEGSEWVGMCEREREREREDVEGKCILKQGMCMGRYFAVSGNLSMHTQTDRQTPTHTQCLLCPLSKRQRNLSLRIYNVPTITIHRKE